jgi:uncharacterized protein YlzI (FlbEa/FlbD family)
MYLKEMTANSYAYSDDFDGEATFAITPFEYDLIARNIDRNGRNFKVSTVDYMNDKKVNKNRTTKETRVIFNPPYTILYMNGNKYISKAHNEAFDEEKGLLMCLAKANGITHLELKRMLKGANRQGG